MMRGGCVPMKVKLELVKIKIIIKRFSIMAHWYSKGSNREE